MNKKQNKALVMIEQNRGLARLVCTEPMESTPQSKAIPKGTPQTRSNCMEICPVVHAICNSLFCHLTMNKMKGCPNKLVDVSAEKVERRNVFQRAWSLVNITGRSKTCLMSSKPLKKNMYFHTLCRNKENHLQQQKERLTHFLTCSTGQTF